MGGVSCYFCGVKTCAIVESARQAKQHEEKDEFLALSSQIQLPLDQAMADKCPKDPPADPVNEHQDRGDNPTRQKVPTDPRDPGPSIGT